MEEKLVHNYYRDPTLSRRIRDSVKKKTLNDISECPMKLIKNELRGVIQLQKSTNFF